MKQVVVDTNMLLVPGQFQVDIFTELERVMDETYEIVILDSTLKELDKLSQGKGDDARAARLGKMLVQHNQKRDFAAAANSQCKGLKIVQGSSDYADDAIVAIAEDDTIVATNDGGLKRRLLERGVRVIYLKQDTYLEG